MLLNADSSHGFSLADLCYTSAGLCVPAPWLSHADALHICAMPCLRVATQCRSFSGLCLRDAYQFNSYAVLRKSTPSRITALLILSLPVLLAADLDSTQPKLHISSLCLCLAHRFHAYPCLGSSVLIDATADLCRALAWPSKAMP